MDFNRFAEQHGLIIDHVVEDRWVRVPTTDHPHKKNGSYKFVGDAGWVQNFATMEEPVMWKGRNVSKPDPSVVKMKQDKANKERLERQARAAKKAGWILKQAKKDAHPYLSKKSFPTEKGYVWNGLLIIPMRLSGNLVGCQLIDANGNKKFLTGQLTKGVSAVFDAKGMDIVCEGYATALSIRRVMKLIGQRYRIHVAFSASNVAEISKALKCVVVADHDPVGIRMAQKSGNKYWVSDKEGEDFNDAEVRLGTEELSKIFSQFLMDNGDSLSNRT